MIKKYVVYSRQSKKSGMKGQMTLETADAIIRHFLNTQGEEGVDYEVVKVFKEVSSSYGSKSANRINFNEAYELCKQNGYTLLVSTASRLARNTAFGAKIIEEIDVVIASNPTASKTMKNIMLVLAEDESIQQSERRRATYQAKKEKCKKLGIKCEWGGNSEKWREKYFANKAAGKHSTTKLFKPSPQKDKLVVDIKTAISYGSPKSFVELADKLNKNEVFTLGNKPWNGRSLATFSKRNGIEL
ncbi:resolvase domain-containing protein [Vibrio phage qdvp001]|uniref:resolvase domain-containing protein n=1 Tax=Vibrio phage qdvp001 TaxID=1003177 RepID=UPI00072006CE|nr:resolvase domain-containing protein [Vibrio phage qdvp001]ALM62204.1 resolvase domain-containing protein [Vibrio phage qdvp001]